MKKRENMAGKIAIAAAGRTSASLRCWWRRRRSAAPAHRGNGDSVRRDQHAASTSAEAAKYRAVVEQVLRCVPQQPHGVIRREDPVNLEAASFDDLLGHAGTWERVLRKLSVRAMPPPGMPRPTEAEYAGFTGWLAASLDRAWEGRSTPGRFVVHRLNRAEYANAIRDLLAVDLDVSDLLPTDGADFGFDNIATSLKTSPLLLEGYVNAAQRVSRDGRGRSAGEARNHGAFDPAANSARTVISMACRWEPSAAPWSITCFPADAEYKLSGRLVRGIAGRLRRRRRKRHTVHLRDHGGWHRSVFGADWRPQGSRDAGRRFGRGAARYRQEDDGTRAGHGRSSRRRLHVERAAVPAAGRLAAVAARQPGSPHDRRACRSSGPCRSTARTTCAASAKGPAGNGSLSAIPPRELQSAAGGIWTRRPARPRSSSNLARRAYRRPVTAADVEAPDVVLQAVDGRAAAISTMAFAPASRAFFRARTSCIESRTIRRAPARASRIR